MLITNAVLLDGTRADVRVGAAITDIAASLKAAPGEDVFDARSGTVLPGLHDHHVHLWAAAAALDSVPVGPPRVRTPQQLKDRLHNAATDSDGWIRGVGYHDSVAGALDRHRLDELAPDTPVRVQHRSGALWALNTAGLRRIGAAEHPDGRFFRTDPAVPRTRVAGLRPLSDRLSAFGVTCATSARPPPPRSASGRPN